MKYRMRVGAMTALLAFATIASSASAKIIDQYCGSSGDYCLSIRDKAGPVIKAEIDIFGFGGPYSLCVDAPARKRVCDRFVITGAPYRRTLHDSVRLGAFPSRPSGRYAVTWRLEGHKLGKNLHFIRR